MLLENEPLTPEAARKLAREILANGAVVFWQHALDELAKDKLKTTDALNVIRAGMCEPAEYEKGEWRYRFRTRLMAVVIGFDSKAELHVVTGWRN